MESNASPQPDIHEVAQIGTKCLNAMMEHVDAALMLVSWKNKNGRTSYTWFRGGNYYACKGMAQEWIEDESAKNLATHLGPPDPPDDGETRKSPSTD